MKIALCYYGLSYNLDNIQNSNAYNLGVNFNSSFPSHKENLIEPNNMDIFIHTWGHSKTNEIIEKYKPKGYLFESQRNFYEAANIINPDPNVWGFHQRHHILSRWYSTRTVLELCQDYEWENNIDYDLIMLTRFDCSYSGKWDLSELNPENFYVTGGWEGNYNTELPDLWFISNRENIYELQEVIAGISKISKDNPEEFHWGGHYLIKKYLDIIGLSDKIKHYKTHKSDSNIIRG